MTKPKKKPKTGDVVGWATVSRKAGHITGTYKSREEARDFCFSAERIAKIVLAK